jgi:Domain of unknown function (DU1801)
MADLKTKPTKASVQQFLDTIADPQQRADASQILGLMKEVTGETPKMWGPTMVGFGQYHYVYASGHEGDYFVTGFSPRKGTLTLYFMAGLDQRFAGHLRKLGKAKTGKGCLYIKRLADVDLAVLREMIQANIVYLADTCKRMADAAAKKKRRKSL